MLLPKATPWFIGTQFISFKWWNTLPLLSPCWPFQADSSYIFSLDIYSIYEYPHVGNIMASISKLLLQYTSYIHKSSQTFTSKAANTGTLWRYGILIFLFEQLTVLTEANFVSHKTCFKELYPTVRTMFPLSHAPVDLMMACFPSLVYCSCSSYTPL